MRFTAIDFETAQGSRWSICQVGLVQVTHGIITARIDILVQPPGNYYWDNFTDIHGICAERTRHSMTFDQVWPIILPFIEGQHVVAHNSAFDFSCIRQTLQYYQLKEPDFFGHCTYKIFGESLAKLCAKFNIELDHHNALSDAVACAELYMKYLNENYILMD